MQDALKVFLALAFVVGIGWGIRWVWTTSVPEYRCDRARERLADAQVVLDPILKFGNAIDHRGLGPAAAA